MVKTGGDSTGVVVYRRRGGCADDVCFGLPVLGLVECCLLCGGCDGGWWVHTTGLVSFWIETGEVGVYTMLRVAWGGKDWSDESGASC